MWHSDQTGTLVRLSKAKNHYTWKKLYQAKFGSIRCRIFCRITYPKSSKIFLVEKIYECFKFPTNLVHLGIWTCKGHDHAVMFTTTLYLFEINLLSNSWLVLGLFGHYSCLNVNVTPFPTLKKAINTHKCDHIVRYYI